MTAPHGVVTQVLAGFREAVTGTGWIHLPVKGNTHA